MPSEDATNYSDKLRLQSRRLQHHQRLQAIVAFHRQPVMHPTRFKTASITYAVNIYYCDIHAVLTDQQIYSNFMLLTILISKHAFSTLLVPRWKIAPFFRCPFLLLYSNLNRSLISRRLPLELQLGVSKTEVKRLRQNELPSPLTASRVEQQT